MDFIFDSELCAEEQEWVEKLDALQREEEEEEAMRGSPLANRREMESKIQKGTAWEFAVYTFYTTCKSTYKVGRSVYKALTFDPFFWQMRL